jgi:tRNA nucleotidyltransferase (CCA-adding enzyme)
MKLTHNDSTVFKHLQHSLTEYPLVEPIVDRIAQAGGRALLVGGAVRDLLLGLPIKDLDIEVHGISLELLESILRAFGPTSSMGKAFGVLRLHGLEVDWALPRTDTAGRKPIVSIDPMMSIKQACARRDLTINAMGIDLKTYELLDPFNGKDDLKQGILRAPDPKLFVEDPLRLYRVMQFVGRFAMQPDATLNQVCASMDITHVSVERIEAEFEKLMLKSARPSLGIRWLRTIGRLADIMPELYATIGVAQNPEWHPEGDVFEHSMQSLDAAAAMHNYQGQEKLILCYAALCHDLGKAVTSEYKEGRIRSLNHEVAGVPLAHGMLARITRTKELIKTVEILVRYHMHPLMFMHSDAKLSAYKRLARALAPHTNIRMLAYLAMADRRGRNGAEHTPLTTDDKEIRLFIQKAEKAGVFTAPEEPVLQGKDLLDVVSPGPQLGQLLRLAYKIQIAEGIQDKEVLRQRVLSQTGDINE